MKGLISCPDRYTLNPRYTTFSCLQESNSYRVGCLTHVLYAINSTETATFKTVQMKYKQEISNLIKMIMISTN